MSDEDITRIIRRRMPLYFDSDVDFLSERYSRWGREGLNITIPRAVLETLVGEVARNMVKLSYEEQAKAIMRTIVVNTIIVPLSIIMTIFAVITVIALVGMGAWITSIPFVFAIVFGVYYNYSRKKS